MSVLVACQRGSHEHSFKRETGGNRNGWVSTNPTRRKHSQTLFASARHLMFVGCAVHHARTVPSIIGSQVHPVLSWRCKHASLHKKGLFQSHSEVSFGPGDIYEHKDQVGAEEVAYFRAKAEYLRRVASAAKPAFVRPAATIIGLLERLAGDFEERAFEVERELKARRTHRK